MLKEHRYQEQERSLLTDLDERQDNVSADTLVNISWFLKYVISNMYKYTAPTAFFYEPAHPTFYHSPSHHTTQKFFVILLLDTFSNLILPGVRL